jgi:hypothetical protein
MTGIMSVITVFFLSAQLRSKDASLFDEKLKASLRSSIPLLTEANIQQFHSLAH